MKAHIQRTSIKNMSPSQWKAHRMSGIGASEVGTILGVNKYKDRIRLFYNKVGAVSDDFEGNIATFAGKAMEDTVVQGFWKYWNPNNPTVEDMIKNGEAGIKQRRCKNYYAYLVNPKYPWLFVSLDRSINAQLGKSEGVLEIKTAEGFAAKQYENNVNPSYVFQIQQQMLVTELKWGEIFQLVNGRHPECFPIEESKAVQETIIEQTKNFWDAVLEGREVWNNDSIPLNDKWQFLSSIEPEPSTIEDHNQFLKEQYRPDTQIHKTVANEEIISYLSDYVEAQVKSKEQKDKQTEAQSKIMKYMQEHEADELEYNDVLLCSWRAAANGTPKFLPKKKAILELCQD